MGVYKSDAKFGIAIYLVPVLDALIVSIKKMLKALKNLPFFTCTILNFEEKFDEKMLKTAFQRE